MQSSLSADQYGRQRGNFFLRGRASAFAVAESQP